MQALEKQLRHLQETTPCQYIANECNQLLCMLINATRASHVEEVRTRLNRLERDEFIRTSIPPDNFNQ